MKTIKNTTKKLKSTLGLGATFAALLLCANAADVAAQPQLTMGQEHFSAQTLNLEQLEIAKVQPTAFMDTSSAISMSEMMAYGDAMAPDASLASRISDSLPANAAQADQGLGFGGQSTTQDIASLQYGYLLGALPILQRADKASFDQALTKLEQFSSLHSSYQAQTTAALLTYIKGARQGQIDTGAYMNIMRAASEGIAQAKGAEAERRHGYLMVGIWSAMSTMALESGRVPSSLKGIGDALSKMLIKDSSFGGSDRALAAHIQLISEESLSAAPDKARVYKSLKSMMSAQADS